MNLRNISDFTNKEFKQQAQHKNFSMIASIMSGVNFSSNKVLYTIYNENITQFQKTETVANITALKTDYHGGSTNLNGVIFNNIKEYIGGNNITLIDKKGDMGSRLNNVCAAPRYNYVRKGKLFDLLFKKEDCNILPRYESEGTLIEYKYMLFILPLLLINGNEGMGSGHAQKILPRNTREISKYIIDYITKGKSTQKLYPYYKGFTGEIEQREESNQWKISGIINRKTKTKTEILEVPINESYNSMIKKLDGLVDKKIIRSYQDLCDTRNDKFYFILSHENLSEISDEDLLTKFKLVLNLSENYTVIDENNTLQVFDNIYNLLEHYIHIRLEYYQKRKDYNIQKMLKDIEIMRNKVEFIIMVNSKIIELNRPKKDIIKELEETCFLKVEDSFDYLLNMKLYNLTDEKVQEIENKLKELEIELSKYTNKDIREIWIEEINELLKALKERPISTKMIVLGTPSGSDELYSKFIDETQQKIAEELAIPKDMLLGKSEIKPTEKEIEQIISISNLF